MFDVTQRISYKNVPKWYKDLTRTAEGIPIVLCGNKADVTDRAVKIKNITYHRRVGIPYYDISAKNNYNFDKPFLKLACMLTKDDKLEFREAPALRPPEVAMSNEHKRALEAHRAAAEAAALPPDDDF
jgi:GTP-binding nuclear protein Ran